MPNVHPTALVDPSAQLADDVTVGPYCIVEGGVEIGGGTVLRDHAVVRRHTTLGAGNFVDAHVVLGGEPQDFKFDPSTVSYLRVGDHNVFREGVTISRATAVGGETLVGSNTYWMTGSHAGHDAKIGDGVVLVNGAAVGGHASLGAGAILSAHVVVHQFCRIGQRVMTEGNASIRSHVPPFTLVVGRDRVFSLNTVGLRRAEDVGPDDRRQLKEAFRLVYRSGLSPAEALNEMDAHEDWGAHAAEFREFVRAALDAEPPYDRGICSARERTGG